VALDEDAFAEATDRGGIPEAAIEARREVFESALDDEL